VAAIGITNQRETTCLWDRARAARCTAPSSGRTAAPSRCASSCAPKAWRRACASAPGWSLDPYFSGTKLAWLLDHRARRTRRRRARRAGLRHHRQLAAVAL
jgi:glycerol kinase